MNRDTAQRHRFTRMQDAGLMRSESVAAGELARRRHTGAPAVPDRLVATRFVAALAAELAAAWAAARKRRATLRALKRVDRRLLRDVGIERGRLREVVDAMLAAQAAAPRSPAVHGRRATAARGWMKAHPAA